MVMVEVTVALVTPIVDESNNSHGVWAQEAVHAAHAGRTAIRYEWIGSTAVQHTS